MTLQLTASRQAWRCATFLAIVAVSTAAGALGQDAPGPADKPPISRASPTPQASPTPTPAPSLERRFFRNILRDQRAIWTSPLHIQGDDARFLVPLGAATIALIATDRHTAGALHYNESRLAVSSRVSQIGATYTLGGIATAFYLFGRAQGNARARETGLLGAEALVNGIIVSKVLKAATQRPRPLKGNRRGRFFDGGNSFPSGHAINAWSLATVIAHEYGGRRPLVRVAAYGLATAVSLSRFTGSRHFLSDVLVGSAIGYGIGRYVYRKHHDPALDLVSKGTPRGTTKLIPLIIPRYDLTARNYGVAAVWSF